MKNNLEEFEMRLFFSLLWKYEVYNVVIETDHQFYTWYPYERWGEMTVRRTNLTQGFANKIPKKLNCTLRIDWTSSSTVVKNAHNETDPGIFILYVNEIAKRMGVSPQYSKTGAGFLDRYRTNRSFEFDKAMEENNVTVAVGQSSYLAPLEQLLILPPRHTKPRWREFFKFDTWTAIFITTVMLGSRPDHAFFSIRLHLEYIKNKENVGKIHTLTSYFFLLLRPRCHLKEKIDFHVRDIEEKGLRHKFELISSMFLAKRVLEEKERVTILLVDDLQGVFLLWISGCILSTVVFCGELAWKNNT
ncbi:hypothetical protein GEV33_000372 [Tenebrio molitor]|uniref:Uncharacterized protein n=1 Tax=Tenebrio molitor TaxID=7067 RepID=A0A8J6HX30_TENMO|nr:hypothetical protein GEV33_000372 [Tenebrio molitor]